MKLKGHATIELTDVNTGEVEVHEDDNMITNALKELISYHGVTGVNCLSDIYANTNANDAIKCLTGGLLLFDKEIGENPENYYAPAGVGLTGCGTILAYSGKNIMAGSYNSTESGKVENGYRHVWDFSTSQANGKIACASLTTRGGGKTTSGSYPYSSDYEYDGAAIGEASFTSTSKSVFFDTFKEEVGYDNRLKSSSCLFIDGKANKMLIAASPYWCINVWGTTTSYPTKSMFQQSIFYRKSIDINIYRIGISNFSIFDNPGSSGVYLPDSFLQETVTIEMPKALQEKITDDMFKSSNYFGLIVSQDESNMYFIISTPGPSTVAENEKFYIWKINAYTFESSYIEVTNTTGEPIYFDKDVSGLAAMYSMNAKMFVFDDYVLCLGKTSSKVYMIRLSDNTDVSEILWPDGAKLNENYNYGTCFGRMWYQKGKIIYDRGDDSKILRVIDPELKSVRCKNILSKSMLRISDYGEKIMPIHGTPFIAGIYSGSNSPCFYTNLDTSLLITINNLSSPVIKTASQTMKVTYTITQAQE